ncbi:HVO_A0114 family putative DNA-binding protein [Natrarchaeobius oligotrophus]|uniref:HVO_A0114 family putative DNA-binding protein n=1 Tax=Natrarchaeobius oligotrophus TaxID=3455743 RepID=UPI001A9D1B3B|nr:hypothetical protein [Natrarchaeobius chitinivorans]
MGSSVATTTSSLAEYDVVHFERAGRAKRPFVPYERIEISLEITTPRPNDDVASA